MKCFALAEAKNERRMDSSLAEVISVLFL